MGPFPGALAIQFHAVTGARSSNDSIEKRWRDSKKTTLERRIPELLTWLKAAAPVVREERLKNECKQRQHAERLAEAERIRNRKKRAKALEAQLIELANLSDARRKIEGLIKDLESDELSSFNIPEVLLAELYAYCRVLKQALVEQVDSDLLETSMMKKSLPGATNEGVKRLTPE